ncbi:MAG: hypothetical protein K0R92_2256 [Lachnospiraceae bacterium]|jgi:hypothetical protein|nr:hypothetical protein [Lachnospiraceae bacterium]
MKDVSWINHPAMKNIDARKLGILVELVNESEGKPVEKLLPILISANAKLKATGLSFSGDETEMIMEILTKDLSEADKNKLEMVKKMIKNNKK